MKPTTEEVLALLAEHGARLHALLFRLTLRSDVAEDLMQDLFCKLAESERFGAVTNPLGYAIRMATNLALDFRRAQRRVRRGEVETDAQPEAADSAIADVLHQEELERMLDALEQLASGGREIIVLRYLEQQDFATIGRQLGKTPHQIRALCHKAIKKLRVALDPRPAKGSDSNRSLP